MAERKPRGRPVPRLAALREQALLTQTDLAERAGMGRTTIARLENGASARYATIRKLAAALGVDARELLGE